MSVPVYETIRLATESVWANRFRSALTILGIVIGITTVVTVASLLTGLRSGIVTFFEEFGPDSVFITRFSGDPNQGGSAKEQKRRPIQPSYAEFIQNTSPAIERVSVTLSVSPGFGGKPLSAKVPGFETNTISIQGKSANSYLVQPRELRAGRVFTTEEENRAVRVCAIGFSVGEALFPDGKAVGKTMIVDGSEYAVIGVFEKAKGGFFGENGLDRNIEIPLSLARQKYPFANNFFLTAKAREGMREDAFEEMQAAMRRLRGLKTGQDNDFNISTADQIIANFDKITGLIVIVSIAISGLGLLVGGIGVMNIMLVSVTERTREIGIRKALGARRPDIVFQFLLEASSLTAMGGVFGIAFATLVSFIIGKLVPALNGGTPLWAVLTGLGVSVAVGVFFGTWPALKASRLDPVEALRYE